MLQCLHVFMVKQAIGRIISKIMITASNPYKGGWF